MKPAGNGPDDWNPLDRKPRMDFRFPCPACGNTYITVPAPDFFYMKPLAIRGEYGGYGNWQCKKCYHSFFFPPNVLAEYDFCAYSTLDPPEEPEYELYSDYRRRVFGDRAGSAGPQKERERPEYIEGLR